MSTRLKRILFLLFFVSGFCGLLYQIVWVRLAFASFGIVTPVLSVVISVFMLGLSLGSWAGGRWISTLTQKSQKSAIYFYAMAEMAIGLGAFVVPRLFSLGEKVLLNLGESNSFDYLVFSAFLVSVSILPWCLCMGATFPFMLAFVKEVYASDPKIFSFLYQANVIGAMLGTLVTACVLVELMGFRSTLAIAGLANFALAATSLWLGRISEATVRLQQQGISQRGPAHHGQGTALIRLLLFTTGFISLALEVIWTRAFTPVLGTQVYAFALLVFVYLLATWEGTSIYRRHLSRGCVKSTTDLTALLALFVLLPIVLNDPRLDSLGTSMGLATHLRIFLVLLSVFPFCAVLGYLTPKLIDEYSDGNARAAGSAYGLNVLGCILGPLCASYILLPLAGVRTSILILAIPLVFSCLIKHERPITRLRWVTGLSSVGLFVICLFVGMSYEEPLRGERNFVVRRDHTATVISAGEGMQKRLLVNGVGITSLDVITKFMAHLPLAFHSGESESVLIICFGMGTTYRSALSWEIKTTAVELVPSVKDAFGFYFDDAGRVMNDPKGKVLIDDGRRFLKRTKESFDVITIDPPPPAEAAGSSLLYSEEFYRLIKQRLRQGGILQQWFAVGEFKILQAVARALAHSFPHVRVFPSTEGWGYHFLASMLPLNHSTAEQLVARLPERARQDLSEWSANLNATQMMQRLLSQEIVIAELLSPNPTITIRDDRPYNEYFLVRRLLVGSPAASSKFSGVAR